MPQTLAASDWFLFQIIVPFGSRRTVVDTHSGEGFQLFMALLIQSPQTPDQWIHLQATCEAGASPTPTHEVAPGWVSSPLLADPLPLSLTSQSRRLALRRRAGTASRGCREVGDNVSNSRSASTVVAVELASAMSATMSSRETQTPPTPVVSVGCKKSPKRQTSSFTARHTSPWCRYRNSEFVASSKLQFVGVPTPRDPTSRLSFQLLVDRGI